MSPLFSLSATRKERTLVHVAEIAVVMVGLVAALALWTEAYRPLSSDSGAACRTTILRSTDANGDQHECHLAQCGRAGAVLLFCAPVWPPVGVEPAP